MLKWIKSTLLIIICFLLSLTYQACHLGTQPSKTTENRSTKTDTVYTAKALTKENQILIGGYSETEFLPMVNSYQKNLAGDTDGFLACFNPNGSLAWSTYLGGSLYDSIEAITLTEKNEILIAGFTGSSDFPQVNPVTNQKNNDGGCFLASFQIDGTLLWSKKVNIPDLSNTCQSMVFDNKKNLFIGGYANDGKDYPAMKVSFPMINSFQSTIKKDMDGYILKINLNGDILWSTYLGGNGIDLINDIHYDEITERLLAGGTTDSNDFPIQKAYQSSLIGGQSSFLTCFQDNGTMLWSTFLGGSEDEEIIKITTDLTGNPIVTGRTVSSNFPLLDPVQTTLKIEEKDVKEDTFLTYFDKEGKVKRSTYFGTKANDFGSGIFFSPSSNLYLCGTLFSSAEDLPVNNKVIDQSIQENTFFITCLGKDWNDTWTTFLGNNKSGYFSSPEAMGIADKFEIIGADTDNNVYVIGLTTSKNFQLTNPFQSTSMDNCRILIAKLTSKGAVDFSTLYGGIQKK